jgi:hypothetical protein
MRQSARNHSIPFAENSLPILTKKLNPPKLPRFAGSSGAGVPPAVLLIHTHRKPAGATKKHQRNKPEAKNSPAPDYKDWPDTSATALHSSAEVSCPDRAAP